MLTPAVYAAAKKAGAKPLPYLLACAFVANAASFVLPISNPANLVIFGARMPALSAWISTFALASLASIIVTFAVLRWLQRGDLKGHIERDLVKPELSDTGRLAACGLALMAMVLLAASALAAPLGPATLLTAALVTVAVTLRKHESPVGLLRGVSWSVLALVAGLFVLVEALAHTGVVALLGAEVSRAVLRHFHRRGRSGRIAETGPWLLRRRLRLRSHSRLPAG